MTDPFDALVGPLLGVEGGYSNRAADAGGETNWGVTVAVARENGYAGPMREMTRTQAIEIYRRRYWRGPGLDLVAAIAPKVAAELFDTGVNCGQGVAGVFLQRSLNVLNRNGRDYADVPVTGTIGPLTLAALRGLLVRRGAAGEAVLLKALNCLQGARYIELAERRASDEENEFGWLANRVGLAA
jgi:lysozyme family protein